MRAAVLTENAHIEIQEREIPAIGRDEYLIKVEAVGICNSDIFRAFANGAYHYPLVMGHEIAGEIVDAGSNATRLRPGTDVVVFPLIPCRTCPACRERRWALCDNYDYFGSRRDGGFQEYLAVGDWNLIPLREGTDPCLACLCEPVAVSVHAAAKLPLSESEGNAAVIGAGIIGISAAKIVQVRGFSVTIIDRNEFKRRTCMDIGLSVLSTAEAAGLESEFTCVVEATGAVEMFHLSLQLAKRSGHVVWVGNIQGDILFERTEISSILRKELNIQGVWNSDYQGGVDDDWARAIESIRSSDWLRKVVSHHISLGQLPGMLERMHTLKRCPQGHDIHKVVVDIGAGDSV